MKKNKISKNWINKQRRDIYVRKSKLEGYRSRAIYKLKEIDDKFKIIRNGIKIVDLGSAPGSWSQYLSEKSKNSKILSIDLKDIKKIHNVTHLIGDFLDEKNQTIISNFFTNNEAFFRIFTTRWGFINFNFFEVFFTIFNNFIKSRSHKYF